MESISPESGFSWQTKLLSYQGMSDATKQQAYGIHLNISFQSLQGKVSYEIRKGGLFL